MVANDYGHCVKPGGAGSLWSSDFGFSVPGIAPDVEYDIKIFGRSFDGSDLFEADSSFRFPK